MSILSSNSARFQVTVSYLEKNGYEHRVLSTLLKRHDSNYNDTYRSHVILIRKLESSEALYIQLGSKKGITYIIPIDNIDTLKLLESFWDTHDQNKKRKLKSKLIKTPGTEIRECKRKDQWWF